LSFTPTPVGNAQESKVEEILQWVDMNRYTVNIANILKGVSTIIPGGVEDFLHEQ